MEYQFSERVQNLKPSVIREILKYSSDPTVIPLSAGNPAPDAFPNDAISSLSAELLQNAPHRGAAIQRNGGISAAAAASSAIYEGKVRCWYETDDILITSGARQVMDLLTKTLLNEGDTVLCEAPSFIGSLNTFRSYRARLVGIPMEADGIDVQQLEQALNTEKK